MEWHRSQSTTAPAAWAACGDAGQVEHRAGAEVHLGQREDGDVVVQGGRRVGRVAPAQLEAERARDALGDVAVGRERGRLDHDDPPVGTQPRGGDHRLEQGDAGRVADHHVLRCRPDQRRDPARSGRRGWSSRRSSSPAPAPAPLPAYDVGHAVRHVAGYGAQRVAAQVDDPLGQVEQVARPHGLAASRAWRPPGSGGHGAALVHSGVLIVPVTRADLGGGEREADPLLLGEQPGLVGREPRRRVGGLRVGQDRARQHPPRRGTRPPGCARSHSSPATARPCWPRASGVETTWRCRCAVATTEGSAGTLVAGDLERAPGASTARPSTPDRPARPRIAWTTSGLPSSRSRGVPTGSAASKGTCQIGVLASSARAELLEDVRADAVAVAAPVPLRRARRTPSPPSAASHTSTRSLPARASWAPKIRFWCSKPRCAATRPCARSSVPEPVDHVAVDHPRAQRALALLAADDPGEALEPHLGVGQPVGVVGVGHPVLAERLGQVPGPEDARAARIGVGAPLAVAVWARVPSRPGRPASWKSTWPVGVAHWLTRALVTLGTTEWSA